MTQSLGLYILIFAAALGALIVRSRLAAHVMLGVLGGAGLAYDTNSNWL